MKQRVLNLGEAIVMLTRMVQESDVDALAGMVSELCGMEDEHIVVCDRYIKSDVYCNGMRVVAPYDLEEASDA